MYVFSSEMTSQPYEDYFQLSIVPKQKNLGQENEGGKFEVFGKIISMLEDWYSQNRQLYLGSNMYILFVNSYFCVLNAHPKTPSWPF